MVVFICNILLCSLEHGNTCWVSEEPQVWRLHSFSRPFLLYKHKWDKGYLQSLGWNLGVGDQVHPGKRWAGREAGGETTCELNFHACSIILSDSLTNYRFKGKLLGSSIWQPQSIDPQNWYPSEGRVLCDCRVACPWSQPLTIHISFLHISACTLHCVCENRGKKRTDHASISRCKSLSPCCSEGK